MGQRPVSRQPFSSWTDFVAANTLFDTALSVLLQAATDSTFSPLAQRAPSHPRRRASSLAARRGSDSQALGTWPGRPKRSRRLIRRIGPQSLAILDVA